MSSLLALPCIRADLVFYSGTYYNPETKAHAFNMTHVEVFVGGASGRATIGEPGCAVHACTGLLIGATSCTPCTPCMHACTDPALVVHMTLSRCALRA